MSFTSKIEAHYKVVSTTVDKKHYIANGIFKKIADKYGLEDFSGEDNKDFIWLGRVHLRALGENSAYPLASLLA